MKKRVGILTSGGDCPGLNATIRGVSKALYQRMGSNVQIVGITNGYSGLINGDYRDMEPSDFKGILTLGGTILGTKRTPFKMMRVVGDDQVDKVAAMKKTYKDAQLDCLLCLGGNGTHKTANLLSEEGLNIIGLPKTIDNDIFGTDVTFGFHTAVDIATEVIDRIHTTAGSHSRVMCIEIMGNKAGWLTCIPASQAARISSCCPSCPTISTASAPRGPPRGERAPTSRSWPWRRVPSNVRGGPHEAQGLDGEAPRGRHHVTPPTASPPRSRKRPARRPACASRPHAARRQPQRLRPRAGHPVRQLCRQAGGSRALRRDRGSGEQPRDREPSGDIAGKTRNMPEGCELLAVARRMGISLG
jgi:hypothetical protein